MKRILASLFLAAFVIGVTGCSSPEEKAVTMMEEMANIIDNNKDDCDKMGKELNAFMDSNKDTIESLKKMKGSEEDKKKMEEKYGERIKTAGMKMMGGALACSKNEAVAAAMKKM